MYELDAMDSVEAYTSFAEIMDEVMRTQIVPELDAYRFSKIYTLCGSDAQATLTPDTVFNAINTGKKALNNLEVPREGRVLFVSNEVQEYINESSDSLKIRFADKAQVLNNQIVAYDDMPIISVPASRFNSAITLNDGTTAGQTDGGYTTTGVNLNFMICRPSEIAAIIKHFAPKVISPEANQSKDAWAFGYREYHDLFIAENNLNGVYIHNKAS
jgi:hypothetical protein